MKINLFKLSYRSVAKDHSLSLATCPVLPLQVRSVKRLKSCRHVSRARSRLRAESRAKGLRSRIQRCSDSRPFASNGLDHTVNITVRRAASPVLKLYGRRLHDSDGILYGCRRLRHRVTNCLPKFHLSSS